MLTHFVLLLLVCNYHHCDARRPNKQLIEGVTLRAPGCYIPPLLFPIKDSRNGSLYVGGLMSEPMDWMSVRYKLKFEIVEFEKSLASDLEYLYEETNRMLIDKEIDIITAPLPMAWDRLSKLDYSYPCQFAEYLLMQKYPEENSRLTAILMPFSLSVWLYSIGIIVIFVTVLTIFTIFHPEWMKIKRQLSAWGHFNYHIEYVTAIITYQGYYVPHTAGQSLLILCGCWGLMMLVLTYAYSGNLTSCLVTPTFHPIANTLADLITMNKKVTIISKSPLAEGFLNAVSGTSGMIGDFLRQNPDMIAKTFDAAAACVLNEDEDCTFIGQADLVRVLILKNYESRRKCALTASKALSYMEHYSYTMVKDNPYLEFVSDSQLIFWEYGLAPYWINKYLPGTAACFVHKNPLHQFHSVSIRLTDVSSAFLFLTFGTGLSIVAFIIECVVSAVSKQKQVNQGV